MHRDGNPEAQGDQYPSDEAVAEQAATPFHEEVQEEEAPSRSLTRVRGRWSVRVVGDEAEHFALDASLGGLFVANCTQYAAGSQLDVTVDFGDHQLTTRATVRWVRQRRISAAMDRGMGVAFDALAAEDLAYLESLVNGAST